MHRINTDRLLRDLEQRLAPLGDKDRADVLDAVRDEIALARRRDDPSTTVEAERERRLEAETLREVLEAINRQASLDDTLEEVLKQLSRIVEFDSCSIALADGQGRFRVIAARGFPDPALVLGLRFRDPLSDVLRSSHQPLALADVQADEGFAKVEGTVAIRSWAGVPLVMEGDTIGILSLDRNRVDPFADEDLHRAKAVAFSAAAAIRKAQLLDQLRRYATLMERTVLVHQAVLAGDPADKVARLVLEGALHLGAHPGGLLALGTNATAHVAAASEGLQALQGREVPASLVTPTPSRLEGEDAARVASALGIEAPTTQLQVVPFATDTEQLGALALFVEPNAPPEDRLLEAYASRCASAYSHIRR
jgi:GAF domain-containing protein